MLGLRYVVCEECGRVTATAASDADAVCGRCASVAVRDLDGEGDSEGQADRGAEGDRDGGAAYFASTMRPE
jgi:hypothetical protein